jgi:hypothetical protein
MRPDVVEFLRDKIRNGLSQCTPEQRALFNKMYKSVEEVPDDLLEWALSQVERTIKLYNTKVNTSAQEASNG